MNLNGDLIEDDDKGSFIHSLMWARIGGEYKLEQYTGLKDKNGKDIYEGDLIQRFSIEFPSRKEVPCEIYEVRWGLWGFELYRKEEPNVTNHYISPKLIEVIGNIHENPELLEAKL